MNDWVKTIKDLQMSFDNIKSNPLDLNVLMSHVGLLSHTVEQLMMAQLNTEIEKVSKMTTEFLKESEEKK